MFVNLKKKFADVIQEGISISENFSGSLKSPTSTRSPFVISKSEIGIPPHINLRAGCNLLQLNEDRWKELHEANEMNVEKAKSIDTAITKIKDRTDVLYVDLTDLQICLSTIPAIEKNLRSCIENVKSISQLCQSMEVKLTDLQNMMEEVDLQERQLEHQFQMSMYKDKKMGELEVVRQKLAARHQENIRQHEKHLRRIQQERQAVFQDAFQQDLEVYREKGKIPKVEHIKPTKQESEVSLEEIILDDTETKNALENFLND